MASAPTDRAGIARQKRLAKLRAKNKRLGRTNSAGGAAPRQPRGGTGGSRGTRPPVSPPYDPSKSPYTTQNDFDSAVNSMAQNQIQPGLDDVAIRERAMQSASDRRMQELRGWYDWAYQGNSANVGAAQTALANAAAAQAQGGQETQDVLRQALGANRDAQSQLVQNLGGQATDTGTQDKLLATNDAMNAALNSAATANANTYGAGMQGDLYTLQLAGIEAAKNEQQRRAGLESGFSNERTQLNNSLGDLRTQARTTLDTQEQTRANQAFQQYLAEQELGLSKKNQSFQQWLAEQNLNLDKEKLEEDKKSGRTTRSLARANYQLDAARVANEARKIEADAANSGDEATQAQAKARADRMRNGATMVNEYLKPTDTDYDTNPDTKKKTLNQETYFGRLSFDDALQQLRTQAGMGPIDSLRLLRNSLPRDKKFDRWRQRADRLLAGHKLARKPGGGRSATPRDSVRPG